jgi:creatinine amidohydrolase
MVLINGHYENMMFTIEGIDLALRELRYDGITDLEILRLEYWDFTRPETLEKVFPEGFPGYALEHAAVMETSLMLHLHPDLVDLAALPDRSDRPNFRLTMSTRRAPPGSRAPACCRRQRGRRLPRACCCSTTM